jgi:hypothetical protein
MFPAIAFPGACAPVYHPSSLRDLGACAVPHKSGAVLNRGTAPNAPLTIPIRRARHPSPQGFGCGYVGLRKVRAGSGNMKADGGPGLRAARDPRVSGHELA